MWKPVVWLSDVKDLFEISKKDEAKWHHERPVFLEGAQGLLLNNPNPKKRRSPHQQAHINPRKSHANHQNFVIWLCGVVEDFSLMFWFLKKRFGWNKKFHHWNLRFYSFRQFSKWQVLDLDPGVKLHLPLKFNSEKKHEYKSHGKGLSEN